MKYLNVSTTTNVSRLQVIHIWINLQIIFVTNQLLIVYTTLANNEKWQLQIHGVQNNVFKFDIFGWTTDQNSQIFSLLTKTGKKNRKYSHLRVKQRLMQLID